MKYVQGQLLHLAFPQLLLNLSPSNAMHYQRSVALPGRDGCVALRRAGAHILGRARLQPPCSSAPAHAESLPLEHSTELQRVLSAALHGRDTLLCASLSGEANLQQHLGPGVVLQGTGTALGLPSRWSLQWDPQGCSFAETVQLLTAAGQGVSESARKRSGSVDLNGSDGTGGSGSLASQGQAGGVAGKGRGAGAGGRRGTQSSARSRQQASALQASSSGSSSSESSSGNSATDTEQPVAVMAELRSGLDASTTGPGDSAPIFWQTDLSGLCHTLDVNDDARHCALLSTWVRTGQWLGAAASRHLRVQLLPHTPTPSEQREEDRRGLWPKSEQASGQQQEGAGHYIGAVVLRLSVPGSSVHALLTLALPAASSSSSSAGSSSASCCSGSSDVSSSVGGGSVNGFLVPTWLVMQTHSGGPVAWDWPEWPRHARHTLSTGQVHEYVATANLREHQGGTGVVSAQALGDNLGAASSDLGAGPGSSGGDEGLLSESVLEACKRPLPEAQGHREASGSTGQDGSGSVGGSSSGRGSSSATAAAGGLGSKGVAVMRCDGGQLLLQGSVGGQQGWLVLDP